MFPTYSCFVCLVTEASRTAVPVKFTTELLAQIAAIKKRITDHLQLLLFNAAEPPKKEIDVKTEQPNRMVAAIYTKLKHINIPA